jgi:hypothetical protein
MEMVQNIEFMSDKFNTESIFYNKSYPKGKY